MSVMGVEMAASRLLAPFFGTSLTVWTSLIGIILMALTAGYWIGGRLADRYPEERGFHIVVLTAGGLISAIPFVSQPILSIAAVQPRVGVSLGSFVAVAVLFAVPVAMLGMAGPYAIRLVGPIPTQSGKVSGSIYALGSAGSIVGTFLPAWVLIPALGTKHTILLFGSVVFLTGAIGVGATAAVVGSVVTGMLWMLVDTSLNAPPNLLANHESRYNYIQVIQDTLTQPVRERRLLALNEGVGFHSIHDPHAVHAPLVGAVWDFMNLPMVLAYEGAPMQTAVIGLAAGTAPHQWITLFGEPWNVRVDGAEIDPAILDIARAHFSLADDEATGRLRTVVADGRAFLRRQPAARYDVILTDAYQQPYVPFHLATVEYWQLVKSRLRPSGVMAINVAATDTRADIFLRILSTVSAVFGEVRYVEVENLDVPFNNYLVLAGRTDVRWERLDVSANPWFADWQSGARHAGLANLVHTAAAALKSFVDFSDDLVLTDDRAPVEVSTEKMIYRYLATHDSLPNPVAR